MRDAAWVFSVLGLMSPANPAPVPSSSGLPAISGPVEDDAAWPWSWFRWDRFLKKKAIKHITAMPATPPITTPTIKPTFDLLVISATDAPDSLGSSVLPEPELPEPPVTPVSFAPEAPLLPVAIVCSTVTINIGRIIMRYYAYLIR